MKVKNLNASSVKTRNLIRQTFVQMLLEYKSIDKIRVNEIAGRAGINRTTFYSHYTDVWEIVQEIEDEILEQVLGNEELKTKQDVKTFVYGVFMRLSQNKEQYSYLLSNIEPDDFLSQIRKRVRNKILQAAAFSDLPAEQLLTLAVFVDGAADELIEFFKGRSRFTFEQIIAGLSTIFDSILG